ncbi:MAG: GNAT family N-acetyltransferase [Acidobacteria bacterium]|nr:GNAT family N-acetyltransferase [Acidobacteriota bacterium]
MENPIVFLQGPRVYLRPVEESDVPRMTRWINDPEIRPYITVGHLSFSTILEREWLAQQAAKGVEAALAICVNDGNRHIGNIALEGINWMSRVATTGTIIGEADYRNRGYGTEAKMLLLHHAFHRLNLRKICSPVFANNARSLRYSQKCGYREEARLKDQHYVDGQYVDEIRLAVFKEDWLPLWRQFQQART